MQLQPTNNVSRGWSLGKYSQVYVIYLKKGGSTSITVPQGNYSVKWYNPRAGGALQNGSVTSIASGTVSIGNPPSNVSSDWVVLIKNIAVVSSKNSYQDSTIQRETTTARIIILQLNLRK